MKSTTLTFKGTMLLIGFFFQLTSYAFFQNPNLDSIKAAKNYEIGDRYYTTDRNKVDSALMFFKLAKDQFKGVSLKGYGKSLYKIGLSERYLGNMTQSILSLNEAIEIGNQLMKQNDDPTLRHEALLALGYSYLYNKEYDPANSVLKELLRTCRLEENGLAKATTAYGLVVYNYVQVGKFDSAVHFSEKALNGADSLRSDTVRNNEIIHAIGNAYSGVGDYYGRIGHFPNFKKYNTKHYDFLVEEYGEGHYSLMWPLLGLGSLAFHSSNHLEGLELYNKALFIAKSYKDSTSDRYALIHDNLHQIYSELEQWDAALFHVEKAMKVYKIREHLKLDLFKLYAVKARILAITGDLAASEENFRLANQAFESETDDYFLNAIAINLVGCLSEMKRFDEAVEMSQKALRLGKAIFPERSFELSQNYHSIALLEMKKGNFDQSDIYLDSARTANLRKDSTHIYTQLTIDMYALEMTLLDKRIQNGGAVPKSAIAMIREAQQFVSGVKSNLESDLGQVYEPNSFYNNATKLCVSLYQKTNDPIYFELTLRLTENDRSFDLKNYIRKADALEAANIPSALEKERDILLNEILTLKYEIDNSSEDLSPKKGLELRTAYDNVKSEYDKLKQKIAEIVPNYFHYKYNINAFNLRDLEDRLRDENTAMISYYATDNQLLTLGSNGVERVLKTIPWNDQIREDILAFRTSLSDPNLADTYLSLSEKLFRSLLDSSFNKIRKETLLIIPDDILNYVPFELLTFSSKTLFEEQNVRYEFSAETFLRNNFKRAKNEMLAMTPHFESEKIPTDDLVRSEIAKLPGATKEVEDISKIMSARTIIGLDATETRFKNLSSEFSILHMATHAIIDDENPNNSKLIFSLEGDSLNDGYLKSYEIYNMNLTAGLVTLSACNTGFGKIQKGEGVMSLSRAFAYAGVPSTVVSLWPASDKSTPELMKYFYENLKEGQTKDVALNNARKSYLATAQGKARHPFYWGGFVLIGDNSPIQDDRNLLVYLIPALLVIVMILTIYRRKKKSI
ncbi:CHAT domain-containing tetratricopeptide repeat protein [Ekhidna sp.]|uniref:CHAT domain-containing protein n=1 Tax=Ekhidna sp. TaxID=2608089 RepID=UPI0032995472